MPRSEKCVSRLKLASPHRSQALYLSGLACVALTNDSFSACTYSYPPQTTRHPLGRSPQGSSAPHLGQIGGGQDLLPLGLLDVAPAQQLVQSLVPLQQRSLLALLRVASI